MESEVTTTTTEHVEAIPPVLESGETEEAKSEEKRKKNGYVPLAQRQGSSVAKAIKAGEDKSLRELIESFGSEGAYQVIVERSYPEEVFDHATGRSFTTVGFCGKYENKPIDEEFVEKKYGGGTYKIIFKERKPNGSGWQFAGQRTIKVQGDPNLTELRAKAGLSPNGTPATNGQTPNENPSIVKEAMGMMAKAVERAEDRAASSGNNDQVITLMREQLAAARSESAELRAEIRQLANKPAAPAAPARSAIEEQMFSALLTGDSSRNVQLQATHASEVRQLKENAAEDLKRQQARFDIQLADIKAAHEREVMVMKQAHDVALVAAKQSHEVQQAASKAAHDLQLSVVQNENKRLEKENDRLQAEVKDLRAKKDLSPIEMMKQVETIKNAIGAGDEEDTSTAGKVVEAITNPGFFEGVAAVVNQLKSQGNAQQQQPPADQQAIQKKQRQIVKHNGEAYLLMEDGSLKGPLQKKKKPPAEAGAEEGKPAEPAMPTVDPGQMAMVINFLESAYSGQQDPEVVAQGARSRVTDELLTAIRDHGVDAVMSKMAKLPGSSPLSSIAGKNWLRKLGAALVG